MADEQAGSAPQELGFQIGRRFYPWPFKFLLGDPVLLEELTGLEYDKFLERLPDEDTAETDDLDPVAMVGLIGVAVWHENPTWKRDRVVRYVQGLTRDQVQMVAPEQEAEPQVGDPDYVEPPPGDAGDPPSESGGLKDSETPTPPSDSETASHSEPAVSQPTSGTSESVTGYLP